MNSLSGLNQIVWHQRPTGLPTWGIPLATGGLVTALFSMTDRNFWQCISQIECTANADLLFQAFIILLIGIFIGFLMRHK